MLSKKDLLLQFQKDWEKNYKLDILISKGFKRRQCKKCGRYFWSIEERDFCGDPDCVGYSFIGNKLSNKDLSYVEVWKKIESYFVNHGHKSIEPYPTVARWRDDLYFTIASINDFQPYVVKGEIEPIANPLIVPQPCMRFTDIENVGITGRHYTNFVMIGQHAFNTKKTGLFYWKEEAITHDLNYVQELGIPLEKIIFHEDVWVGGGNFGPSMEYFVDGLELGNCVFMQYEKTADGVKELDTRVIDMGAGLSRFAWIVNGAPTSYEIVLGDAVDYIKSKFGAIFKDDKLFVEYMKLAGSLNIDEVKDIENKKEIIAKQLGVNKDEFFTSIQPLFDSYATADHLLSILFTTTDGMMPSNSGGGYNLRLILRRVFGFEDKYNVSLDYAKIIEMLIDHLKGLFDRYKEGVETSARIVEEERKKYENMKRKMKGKLTNMIKKKNVLEKDDLILLYESYGISPDYVVKILGENHVNIPPNFYQLVKHKEEKEIKIKKSMYNKYPPTEKLYYIQKTPEFYANVIGIEDNYVVLDKTNFYPEGGGQIGDTGSLDGIKVINTIKDGNVILHEVKDSSKFKVGRQVYGVVNWNRRLNITRHHTATHLVTSVSRQILGPHVWQAGAKKDDEKAHIDLTHYKRITDEELRKIEEKVNEYIIQNLDIEVKVMNRNEAEKEYGFRIYQGGAVPGKELRIVKIGNVDVEACGGTHNILSKTGEIGCFKIIKRETVKDGVERITFKVGIPAIRYVQEEEKMIKELTDMLSIPKKQMYETVKRFFEEWKQQRKSLDGLIRLIKQNIHGFIELPINLKQFKQCKCDGIILLKDATIFAGKYVEKGKELSKTLNIKAGGTDSFYIIHTRIDKEKLEKLM